MNTHRARTGCSGRGNLHTPEIPAPGSIPAKGGRRHGTRRRFLGGRNWLSLCPDAPPHSERGRLWAEWTVEGEGHPYTKAIHAVEEP